jgi:hypothetical protein
MMRVFILMKKAVDVLANATAGAAKMVGDSTQ